MESNNYSFLFLAQKQNICIPQKKHTFSSSGQFGYPDILIPKSLTVIQTVDLTLTLKLLISVLGRVHLSPFRSSPCWHRAGACSWHRKHLMLNKGFPENARKTHSPVALTFFSLGASLGTYLRGTSYTTPNESQIFVCYLSGLIVLFFFYCERWLLQNESLQSGCKLKLFICLVEKFTKHL